MTRQVQPPKLLGVFTEESSKQATPLQEEPAAPPVPTFQHEIAQTNPAPGSDFFLRWYDVASAFGLWISSVGLLLLIPVLFTLPYLVYALIEGGQPYLKEIQSDRMLIFFSVVGILPTHILTLVLVWMYVSQGGTRPFWKTIRFEWPQKMSPVIVVILSVLLSLVLLTIAYLVTTLYGGEKTQLDLLIESSIYTRIATALVALVTAPLVEEVIYRGVIYSALEKAGGTALAIVVASLLFAGVHVIQYQNNISVILMITMLSITLSVSRAISGSLIPPFIIHLIFNGIQSIVIVAGGFVNTDSLK